MAKVLGVEEGPALLKELKKPALSVLIVGYEENVLNKEKYRTSQKSLLESHKENEGFCKV